jgi:hypothetical protein
VVSQAKRRKFLAPEALDRAANEMARLAREQGVRAAVVGGLAMQLYGSDRLTMDVDFIADRKLNGPTVKDQVAFGGDKLVSSEGVPVDWVIVGNGYSALFGEAIRNAKPVRGQEYRVVPLPYLAALKMVARAPRHMADLFEVLSSGKLNVKQTRQIVRRTMGCYAADRFDDFVAEARWRKESGK